MDRVIGLFPTPLMHAPALAGPALVAALVDECLGRAGQVNSRSAQLSHTEILSPSASPHIQALAQLIGPKLVEFGQLLFGEPLPWAIKELWVNVLETGGQQAMHNHANSFASGIVYLTRPHPSTNTVFIKPLAGGFVLANRHAGTQLGAFNADKWVMPEAAPGDMVLFPSHLLHEVPANAGGQRVSLAFNAIPERLDSWGYRLRFSGAAP